MVSLDEKQPKTNAERQKAYRERHKSEPGYKAKRKERKQKERKARNKKRREDNLTNPKASEWVPCFVGVDGESFLTGRMCRDGKTPEQMYSLLKRADKDEPLYKPEGISTFEALDYLSSYSHKSKPAMVGFFLGFDFEWILKDLTEPEYMRLREGAEVSLYGDYFRLKWLAGKRLEILRLDPRTAHHDKPKYYRSTIQDTQGFFQSSFTSALKKFGLDTIPEYSIITDGKAARGDFLHEDWQHWAIYNDAELTALEKLMHLLYDSFKAAYEKAGLSFRVHSGSWSGPGWFANDFLKQTFWKEEHPPVCEALLNEFWPGNEALYLTYPHSLDAMEYARYLYDTEMLKPVYYIVKKVQDAGGIRIGKGMSYFTEYQERVSESIRRRVANKKTGLAFDVMADTLGQTPAELLTLLSEASAHPLPKLSDFTEAAKAGVKLSREDAVNYKYPFSIAYYGGRIELSAIGKFNEAVYDGDINSAYPYALSLLPAWSENDFYREYFTTEEAREAFHKARPMGMVQVVFNFDGGYMWNPFPVRVDNNVYYPREGITWVMTPEYFAMLDTIPAEEREKCFVREFIGLTNSDGYGDALTRMPEERLCSTARKVVQMARVRLECKDASKRIGTERELPGDATLATSEKALKLILNSLYGKTVQQVGSHKNFQDFAAAWTTSVCRAFLWRALAPERKTDNVVMCMTDGIYSRKPLPYVMERISKELGEWELNTFDYFETFKPGIYRYREGGKMSYKVRGYLAPSVDEKERLFSLAWESMTSGQAGTFPSRNFIPRVLAREGWQREPYRYQFYESEKDISSELRAKRHADHNAFLIPDGAAHAFFPPKWYGPKHNMMNISEPYVLKFKDTLDPDEDMNNSEYHEWLDKMDAYNHREEYAE